MRGALVLVETALAVVLVVWSGLLARDLSAMAADAAEFRSEGLVAAEVALFGRPDGESESSIESFFDRLEDRVLALPGVTSVAMATELPLSGSSLVTMMTPEDVETTERGEWMPIVGIRGDWFRTQGVRVTEGRAFREPAEEGRMVAVVNEAFVRRYWPDREPLGKWIKNGGPAVADEGRFEVVGVIADIRAAAGEPTPPKVYVHHAYETTPRLNVIMRTDGDVGPVVSGLRGAVSELDPGLPISNVTTLDGVVDRALATPTFYATLFSAFGFTAFLLALVGVYGTTAYATATRSREIGIRTALGEARGRIVGRVLGRTATVVGAGVVVGAAGAFAAGRIGADALRLVSVGDPLTYAAVGCVVLATALAAAWIPAHRLSHVDPAETLRRDS